MNDSNPIKIIAWNCRGIRNKQIELFNFLAKEKVDVALLSETWLAHNVKFKHPNFCVYRNDRPEGRGGGVAIVIRKNIKHECIQQVKTKVIENIGVSLNMEDNTTLKIFSCYFPGGSPGRDNVKKANFRSDMKKFARTTCRYVLGGDFNCRNQAWGCQRSNCWGNILLNLLTTNTFAISYPHSPTYIPTRANMQPSVLDFFLTNSPHNLNSPLTLNNLSSDHLPVVTNYKSRFSINKEFRYNFAQADWRSFQATLSSKISHLTETTYNSTEDIDNVIDHFSSAITEAIDQSIPKRPVKNIFCEEIPQYVLSLIRMRNKHRREWIKHRNLTSKKQIKTSTKPSNIICFYLGIGDGINLSQNYQKLLLSFGK